MLRDSKIGSIYYEAKDGREAISQYIMKKPHLVIMDIVMPDVDGVKATQAIIQHDPKAKIIIVSTKENKEIVTQAIKSGAKDYVFKPFDSGQVVMAVSKQLVTNRLQKKSQQLTKVCKSTINYEHSHIKKK